MSSNSSMTSSNCFKSASPRSLASASSIIAWSCTASPKTAIVKPVGARMNARGGARVTAIVLLFTVTAPVHLASKLLFGRSPVPPWFLGVVAWLIGARIRTTGGRVRPHTLLVCNHTSWIDILVAAAATKCAFVSKDELGHPMIHWLADQNDTVYVKRSHRKGSKDQAIAIAKALEREK